jgi:MarR family 2-MHQ and catechol resistance regulon transcriptional repressor
METAARIRLVLWKAAKAMEKADRVSMAKTELIPSDFAIMEVLLHKGPLPINTIGEKVLLTSGSMTAAVNRLEKRGFVSRKRDRMDRRCFHVNLTEIGRQVIQQAYITHENNLETIAAVLTNEERKDLVRLLKKIGYQAESIPFG